MKYSMNIYFKLSATLLVLILFWTCSKDKEETKNPYYGSWQSRAYPSMSTPGALERMEFTFTNNSFEDKIYQGATADALQLAAGIRGDISYTPPATLDATIIEISIQGGPYVSKETDPTAFATTFGATLGVLLYEEFTATYEFSNDTLILTLPMKNPQGGDDLMVPLRLTQME